MYVCHIQVYTVGPDYAHAEARKSPALDGKVERNKDGKEIRYPVLLSAKEKLLARTVCLAFKVIVIIFSYIWSTGIAIHRVSISVPYGEMNDSTSRPNPSRSR